MSVFCWEWKRDREKETDRQTDRQTERSKVLTTKKNENKKEEQDCRGAERKRGRETERGG